MRMQVDPIFNLSTESLESVLGLNVGCEGKRGTKVSPRVFICTPEWMVTQCTAMGKGRHLGERKPVWI